jgi:crotonobetaine/carnitine-CoA ligase
VLRDLLQRRAAAAPDQVFAVFENGVSWTHAELLDQVRRTAAGLQAHGVGQDDMVVCWLPNGPDVVRFWFAINYLGAVYVPINTAYRGNVLSHVIENSGARLAIADGRLVARLADCETLGDLATVAVVGSTDLPGLRLSGLDLIDADRLVVDAEPTPPARPVEPWDTQAILYTSGTTGPSKGVLTSYVQTHEMFGPRTMRGIITGADRFLINMPMFHVGGASLLYAMLLHGGSVAVVERFSTESFWPQIRETGSTIVFLLGVMAMFVEGRAGAPDDAENPLRKVFIVPAVEDVQAFRRRFGVDVISIYNMTELSTPLITEWNPTIAGTCGRVRRGIEVRLVDEHDCEVATGEVGEIIVRSDLPWALNHGYHRMPEATAVAWRNGWFHTGDAARCDADGNYFFVDRLKDTIRRRGENISSVEVETEVLAHPAVREAAAVAVRSELAEDEVLVVLALVPDAALDPTELVEFLRPRCAHYMIPRFVRIVPELPKTPTAKVQKAELRAAGVTPDTWDRDASGIVIRGERLATGGTR